MKKITIKVLLIGAILLFVATCSNTTNNATKTVQEVQDTLPVVVEHLNNIQTIEAELQTDWESDINDDATLASYTKKQGKVFDNIQKRNKLLQEINKLTKIIRDDAKHLENLNRKDLPAVELQVVFSNLGTIVGHLEAYQKLCEQQLAKEEAFFAAISKNSWNTDELKEQIKTLNQAAIERQQLLEEMNTPLAAIDKPIRILKARLAASKEES